MVFLVVNSYQPTKRIIMILFYTDDTHLTRDGLGIKKPQSYGTKSSQMILKCSLHLQITDFTSLMGSGSLPSSDLRFLLAPVSV